MNMLILSALNPGSLPCDRSGQSVCVRFSAGKHSWVKRFQLLEWMHRGRAWPGHWFRAHAGPRLFQLFADANRKIQPTQQPFERLRAQPL